MKKLFLSFILVFTIVNFISLHSYAQETDEQRTEEVVSEEVVAEEVVSEEVVSEEVVAEEEAGVHYLVKKYFIEGGPFFMSLVILCLIFGLAIVIERIIYLTLSTTNTKQLLTNIETALNEQGVDAALEVCRDTRGPVASIFYQGLSRTADEGVESAEKSIVSYGGVQMGLLEKGLSWISLFIALAPMLGFMGTVLGMIGAFDAIEKAGDINASLVAGGIKIALITTVSGLIVAIILQIFYNFIVEKIDGIVSSMEDASISLVDILVKHASTTNTESKIK